ncbi:response regulator transcription factor [Aquimarina sp. 2201CG5-10]|uniref:response regulator transcription factor n=1 Tax=Aquimarina callyspongiae TaxID=3098150 RepID=UPI002AB341A5|nr:response regulator transcription factor [Aquimarina sp. 2201CG5-10]MDY8138127.1 response regulator transcription factor [Aquimarina sp. 2201CG5-10]
MNKISVTIVDDDALIVSLLEEYLRKQDEIQVCFTADSGEELLSKLTSEKELPEVLILDLNMKNKNGAEVATFLKSNYPNIKTIIMSSHYKKSFMGFMLKAGASAFVPKGISPQQLVEIINEVYQKGFYFMEDQVGVLRDQVSPRIPQPTLIQKNVLTEREIEILKLICFQKTAKEIGEQLFITPRTVEGHKNNLFIKTEAKNIAGLVIYAIQNNFIEPSEIPLI